MKVVVWKSYGDIKVYDAQTADQLECIVRTMISCLNNWCLEDTIAMVEKHLEKHLGDYVEMVRAFNTIRNKVVESDHESFEDIFIADVLEKCQ